jgi:hypothetical protein
MIQDQPQTVGVIDIYHGDDLNLIKLNCFFRLTIIWESISDLQFFDLGKI